jgi:hypothetical protein
LDCSGGLVSLVVVVQGEEEVRYWILETVRQYVSGKLDESADRETVSYKHANYFLDLAEEAEIGLTGPGLLETKYDNLRTAQGWLAERGEAERGLRLAAALLRFWWFRGHLAEVREQLEGLLDPRPVVPVRDEVRAKALHALGIHRYADDAVEDWAMVRSRLQESLERYRRLGDQPCVAAILQNLGRVSAVLGEWTAAHYSLNESLEIGRRLCNEPGIALSLFYLGKATFDEGRAMTLEQATRAGPRGADETSSSLRWPPQHPRAKSPRPRRPGALRCPGGREPVREPPHHGRSSEGRLPQTRSQE